MFTWGHNSLGVTSWREPRGQSSRLYLVLSQGKTRNIMSPLRNTQKTNTILLTLLQPRYRHRGLQVSLRPPPYLKTQWTLCILELEFVLGHRGLNHLILLKWKGHVWVACIMTMGQLEALKRNSQFQIVYKNILILSKVSTFSGEATNCSVFSTGIPAAVQLWGLSQIIIWLNLLIVASTTLSPPLCFDHSMLSIRRDYVLVPNSASEPLSF